MNTHSKAARIALAATVLCGGLALSACGGNPQTYSQTTEETTTTQTPATPAPAPMAAPMPGDPGTVTTQTTHSETVPAQ